MTKITIDECVYYVHPIYDLYAGSKDGNVINIIKQVPHKGNKTHRGYLNVGVRKHSQSGVKSYQVHRFVWECFNGVIPEGKVIDHINNNKEDNRLCNLQLITHSHSNFSWTTLSKGERCMRLSLCKAPTHETRPDHNTGNYVPYSFR